MNHNYDHLHSDLNKLGIQLEAHSGHLFYDQTFKPIELSIQLMIVRHGETFGNCGQSTREAEIDFQKVKLGIKNSKNRIYQGDVDKAINQLTPLGKQQAIDASLILEKNFLEQSWIPDFIFYSPLSRAKNTGLPFIKRNHFESRYFIHHGIKEMSFGVWENQRICDMDEKNPCHLLYLNQNSLVKESGINIHGIRKEAENFCEVLLRAYRVCVELDQRYSGKKILLFSHSMFGAACSILAGLCQTVENDEFIAFDGKKQNGDSYTLAHATPFLLF